MVRILTRTNAQQMLFEMHKFCIEMIARASAHPVFELRFQSIAS